MVLSSIHTTFAPGLQRHCPPNLLTNLVPIRENGPNAISPCCLDVEINVVLQTVPHVIVEKVSPITIPSGPTCPMSPSLFLECVPCVPTT